MPLKIDDIKAEIEKELEDLAIQKGSDLAEKIRPILYTNLDRGRIQVFIEGNVDLINNYVQHVTDRYEILNPVLHELQVIRSNKAWDPLFEKMLKWAYNFLKKRCLNENMVTRENAAECATEAAVIILKAYFPYDTELDPWTQVILHHACQKFIRKNNRPTKLETSLDELESEFEKLRDPTVQEKVIQRDLHLTLSLAMKELPESRRELIELMYFHGFSVGEIAEKMGKSVGAVYNLHFNALHELRKILGRNRDNLNG